MDKAGQAYWDSLWTTDAAIPKPIDPHDRSLRNDVNLRIHEWYAGILTGAAGKRLLEVGCAKSRWLPYFAREFAVNVAGLDYSEPGCRAERAILESGGVVGPVVCADFFSPPEDLLESFDFVVSLGVAEHFDDTADCLRSFARFLRPGGELLTLVPNLTGTIGVLQKALNRPVYDVHVPLSKESLTRAHSDAGLEILDARYLLSTNFGVANVVGLPPGIATSAKAAFFKSLVAFSAAIWMFERIAFRLPAGRLFAPYVVCRARKPV